MMLEGLDRVDWSSVEHAYGPAEDVPDLLRALLKEDEREQALWALHGNIVHQGTRYPATPHAIPFIVAIVANNDLSVAVREGALALLTSCMTGWLSPGVGPFNADGPIDKPEPKCDTDIEIRRAIDTAATQAIVPARALLDDERVSLRMRAAAFLACFRTRAAQAELVHAIRRRLDLETEPNVRVVLAFALGHLLPKEDDASLRALHDRDVQLAVRTMAAIMLMRRGVDEPMLVETLAAALEADEGDDEIFRATPLHSEGMAGDAAGALKLLGRRASRLMPLLIEKLKVVGDFESVDLLETALGIAFGDTPRRSEAVSPETLTDMQRELLVGLVENDNGFWECGNAMSLLMERGLPSMREELAKLLGVTFTHDRAKAALRSAELMLHTFKSAERALEDAERALRHNPQLGRAHLVKGFCLLHMDDVEGAMESFKSAIPFVILDDLILARKNTATLLGSLGRRDEGLPYLEASVKEFPESADTWYDLGLSLVKAGRYDRCIEAMERALQLRPRHANSHYTIACAWALRRQEGDIERALGAIQRAVEIHPELRESIRDDEDFEKIRDDARFVALVGTDD